MCSRSRIWQLISRKEWWWPHRDKRHGAQLVDQWVQKTPRFRDSVTICHATAALFMGHLLWLTCRDHSELRSLTIMWPILHVMNH